MKVLFLGLVHLLHFKLRKYHNVRTAFFYKMEHLWQFMIDTRLEHSRNSPDAQSQTICVHDPDQPYTPSMTRPDFGRFGFLALRVGVARLLRLLCTGTIALLMWLVSQLDYARHLRAPRHPAPAWKAHRSEPPTLLPAWPPFGVVAVQLVIAHILTEWSSKSALPDPFLLRLVGQYRRTKHVALAYVGQG